MGDGDSHLSILGPQGWGKAVHLLSLRLLWGAAITPETPARSTSQHTAVACMLSLCSELSCREK